MNAPTDALDRIAGIGVLPVIVIDDASAAADLAYALIEGGIPCAEIALRTPGAEAALGSMAAVPGFIATAGTVVDTDQARRAVDRGAAALVSPGLDDALVEEAARLGAPALPGVATATEVQHALRLGLRRVKFFPAEQSGGVPMIDALSGPFPDMLFLPSGGVTLDNAAAYGASPHVFAVSGSWMAPRRLIADGGFEHIASLARETMKALRR